MCDKLCAYLFVGSVILMVNCVDIQKLRHPANPYVLVRPVVHHGRTKRELSTTRHESGTHHYDVVVTIAVDGKKYELVLKLNHGLLPEGHTISYEEGGETVLHKPKKEEIDLCQYYGHIRGNPNSWVALSTCHGIRGVINDGTKIRYIEPAEGRELQSLHYVYEKNDHNTEHRCGNDELGPRIAHNQERNTWENCTHKGRHKRDTFPIGGPYKSNERSRYVELVLVADHAQYLGAGRNLKKLHHQLQETTNILNAFYAPLNIFIALTGVQVWTEGNRIVLSENSTETLLNFMKYRREVLIRDILHHDHAHLITETNFLCGVIGLAYVGAMCTYHLSGAIIQQPRHKVTAALIATTANTMAHEMGHSFGMSHDDNDHGCRDRFCIMYPSSVNYFKPSHFSDTSLKELFLGFHKGRDYCLRNKPASLFGSPLCGNGFVDPGEECDCGASVQGLDKNGCEACCNPETCQLETNATCATGACCDLQKCQLKSIGTLCRSAERECDLPEYCKGDSEFCPDDVFKMDTTPCSKQAYCIQGNCRSHDSQCHLLWGSTGKNGDRKCYDSNTNTKQYPTHINCGFDLVNDIPLRCSEKDKLCGRLYCHHHGERVQFGDHASPIRIYPPKLYNDGPTPLCEGVRVDVGVNDVDPGLVPDGAECGDGQMCLKQKCVSVNYVRRGITQHSEGCLANCSGHGVCNSKGHCHCDDGFAPPLCDQPGNGGSEDSGPASDPRVLKTFKEVMYIIFLGIVPLIVLILLLIYCIKRKPQSVSATTSIKKAIHSLIGKIERNSISSNTLAEVNKNDRPETKKKITKYDIKIDHDVKIETPRAICDNNINVNLRNQMLESTMKLTNSSNNNMVHSIPLQNNLDVKLNLKNNKNVVDIKVDPRPLNKTKHTHLSHAIPPKHITENVNNVVPNAIIAKQKFEVRDVKPVCQPKPINKERPMVIPKSIQVNQKDTNTTEQVNKSVLAGQREPLPKLRAVKNSPLSKDLKANTSQFVTNEPTQTLPEGGTKVKNMRNLFEQQ